MHPPLKHRRQSALEREYDRGRHSPELGIVSQAVRRDLFSRPQAATTLCNVVCTPPESIGVVAVAAPFKPPCRLGNNSTGLRWTCQKRRKI